MKNKTKAVQRSLKRLREEGWQAAVVEKWIPPRGEMKFGVRQDVWGFGDILACRCAPPGTALRPGKIREIALVQAFPLTRWKDHLNKILNLDEFHRWKECDGITIIDGWALKPKDGVRGAKKEWTLRREVL